MATNHHGTGLDPLHASPLAAPLRAARWERRTAFVISTVLAASLAVPALLQPASAYAQASEQASQQAQPQSDDLATALAPYDEQIRRAGSAKDLAAAAANGTLDEKTELLILQRELVARTGGTKLWEYAAESQQKSEFVSWLLNDRTALRHYVTGGTVWANPQNGPTAADYIKSLDTFRRIRAAHLDDLKAADGDVFLRMMISASMDVSDRIRLWTGDPGFVSDPLVRYETIKTFRADSRYRFQKDLFDALPVESMRYVFENQITDAELPWLANYSLHRQPDPSKEGSRLDAYTYIWYGGVNDDFTKDNGYSDARFYDDALFRGPVTEHKPTDGKGTPPKTWQGGWKEKYRLVYEDENFPNAKPGDPFHIGCGDVSDAPGATTNKTAYHRLWMVFEKGGVCGALAKTYANLNGMVGVPSYVMGQPGHAATATYELRRDKATGKQVATYRIQNAVTGWSRSKSPSVAHWLCGWGRGMSSEFAGPYVLYAQEALNDLAAYEGSYLARLVGSSFEGVDAKLASADAALAAQPSNYDAIMVKIALLEQKGASAADWLAFAKQVAGELAYHPVPMNDLLKLIASKTPEGEQRAAVHAVRKETLAKAAKATDAESLNPKDCRDTAADLLKQEG